MAKWITRYDYKNIHINNISNGSVCNGDIYNNKDVANLEYNYIGNVNCE